MPSSISLRELSSASKAVEHRWLAACDFQHARQLQAEIISLRETDACDDTFLYCEHGPTLTLGKRTLSQDLFLASAEWQRRGFAIYEVNRGGGPTLHLPGQLVVYPVVKLRNGGRSVREFISNMLSCMAQTLAQFGVQAIGVLDPPGVWVGEHQKIGAVGLRVVRGVTDHGFSLNLNCELKPFEWMRPCGLTDIEVISARRLVGSDVDLKAFAQELSRFISASFEYSLPKNSEEVFRDA